MKKQFKKALVILGSQGSGKSNLAESIASMFHPGHVRRITEPTDNVLPWSIAAGVYRLLIVDEVTDANKVQQIWDFIVKNFAGSNRPIPSAIFLSQNITPYDLPDKNFDFVEVQNPYLSRKARIDIRPTEFIEKEARS